MLCAAAIRVISVMLVIAVVGMMYVFAVNGFVRHSTADRIISTDAAADIDADCILVLGAGVSEDGHPRLLLRDRLNTGIELYRQSDGAPIIMSGDHGTEGYDEVNSMKRYAIDAGVPQEDIFMDHAGFSTYESLYRARDIFGAQSVVIVTQRYHLYRALYIAERLGLEAVGVACDPGEYHGQIWLDAREVLARNKDFIYTMFAPLPTYLGDDISLSGSGDVTNDKNSGAYLPAMLG
ncbi:MAG: YdcF family protein [Clostridia bacterium]|nr:YdcF family protein [Clostridia bacterium]